MNKNALHNRHPCLVCLHVFDHKRPVLLVVNDDRWMFLCGMDDHLEHHSEYKIVGFGHLIQSDPSLHEVTNLKPGSEAERGWVGDTWIRRPTTNS